MFEQDYVMRLIKELVRAILKLVYNIDTSSPMADILEDKEARQTLDDLLDLVDRGNINEAENYLYDVISDYNVASLEMVLLFYSYLNDKTDDFLEHNDFSREEIKMGIEDIANWFGLSGISKIFLED